MTAKPIRVFWFRRDLRLSDNAGLAAALGSGAPVLPLFIFDTEILNPLEDHDDPRVTFIHRTLMQLDYELREAGSGFYFGHGKAIEVWRKLVKDHQISEVYYNRDYEPRAIKRDAEVGKFLESKGIVVHEFKDQVIFDRDEVVKDDGEPYTVFTPFMKKWRARLGSDDVREHRVTRARFHKWKPPRALELGDIGFRERPGFVFPSPRIMKAKLESYRARRDRPDLDATTHLGLHLRFGTGSIRKLVRAATDLSAGAFLNELIWREFFMQILYHFPHVVGGAFRQEYDRIRWRNNDTEFQAWCEGRTGVSFVDAGMRELNATGFMHNRARMVAASFLVKHLLVDWRWGEAYFARRLLDFDLAANNGNWQWVAGTGCDAAPYFRIFNPEAQAKKFDPDGVYVKKWCPEYSDSYPEPLVDMKTARIRALKIYREALAKRVSRVSDG